MTNALKKRVGLVVAKAMVLATGASYRRLGVPQLEAMIGAGVFYGATVTEAEAMSGEDVFVVGVATPPAKPQSTSRLSPITSHS
jgi:thioredoxin reductase